MYFSPEDFTGTISQSDTRVGTNSGNFGYYGDNGQLIAAENVTIVDETNNTYTNPQTGVTTPITNWTYDYGDRSYTLSLEGDLSAKVTFGDENVTIVEGDTTYNVYYVNVNTGGGTPPPSPSPSAHAHTYTSVVTTEPTCTASGLRTYTCSECGDTYTESIPAAGHKWTVKQTVTTQYDENGNLVTQGYTLYECSVCGEQYKDENGTGPPGGGSSGEEDGNWFTKLLAKIGELLGSVVGGLLEIIGNALMAIIDSLITLVSTAVEKLANLVNLFGSFGEALKVLWSWLPEEVVTVLVAGVTVVIFVAVLKIFL